MACDDCRLASVRTTPFGSMHPLQHPRFNPACLVCGGRILCVLQKQPGSREERVVRLRAALEGWKAYGHPESELRAIGSWDWKQWAEWAHDRSRL